MAVSFKNYSKKLTSLSQEGIVLLTGASGGTVVKSLQVINSNQSCTINVIRKDNSGYEYANVRVDLKANDYLILWQGFFVIPKGHLLCFNCSVLDCTIIANVVELT